MSTSNTVSVTVHDLQTDSQVARIVLNGYRIRSGGPLGNSGALQSFKLVEGDLWSHWENQAVLVVRAGAGRQARIRVAAMPAEEGSLGFIEFI